MKGIRVCNNPKPLEIYHKSMKPFNILLIIFLILIVSGFIYFKNTSSKQSAENSKAQEPLINVTGYLEYSPENQTSSQFKGNSVLFFAATTWCQTCSALEKEIIERSEEIPNDITILKVDYDNNKQMNAKYGVTTQHTLIVLDQNGKEVHRWIGGGFDTLLQQVNEI